MISNNKYPKILIGLIIISLFINYFSFSKIGQLQERLEYMENSIRWNTDSTRSSIYDLSHQLNEQKELAKWIINEEFVPNYEESTEEAIHLYMTWAFREIETNANVSLFYRQKNSDDWIEVEALHHSGTNYRVPIVLSPFYNYEYQIVAEKSIVKSGEITEIPPRMYKPMPMMSNGYGYSSDHNGNMTDFSSNIAFSEPPLFDFYKMKHGFIEAYDGDTVIRKQPFELEYPDVETEFQQWVANIELNGKTVTSIRLVVEYHNGTIHEGEIWPNDTYHNFN
ncbi:hypothetical protein DS745_01780 [Anaerobacillus alkaliphilus]|uniref:Uncharacterized protein n=1 Tax=Anaerobacillus alkaliphilus TaxID=1548597 RepID=A0A4Q0VXA3_9BACI|nr:hypothetical protein [Anaerobacillus alkaliphilus]RXJ04139.1 hypothetical protein DS745_01780 [Anaerobacillus alkaliphilus]